MKPLIRPYIRERHFAVVASQNFLAAFGVFLAEEGWQHIEDEKFCRNCGADMRGEEDERT